jgi:NAD(P)-dependent dehydrogenase (short-subunit alcohol dehydrogenase family)
MELEKRTAMITGGGRGLGRATALAMAREGAAVSIMSRTREELRETARLVKERGGQIVLFRGDVSRERDVQRWLDKTLKRFSRVDVLVNNAAVIGPVRFLEDADRAAWDKIMAVNLHGPFFCCRAVALLMQAQGGGRIINVASGLGQMPFPRFCAYSVTKAGIIQLTRSLSSELSPFNIRVNAIDPGVMDTAMQEELRDLGPEILGQEIYGNFAGYKRRGDLRDPAEVAELIVFLASHGADSLNGHIGTLDDYRELGWKPTEKHVARRQEAHKEKKSFT